MKNNSSFWIAILIIVGLALYQTWSYVSLHGDGAFYLLQILTEQETFLPYGPRSIANKLTQFIPVTLIKLGVSDIKVIALSFDLNLHLFPIAGLVLSYLILPSKQKGWIIFALASYLLILHHNSYYISHESYVAAAFFWPILYYLAFGELTRLSTIVTIFGIVMMSGMHESSVILYFVLILLLFLRHHKLKRSSGALHYLIIIVTIASAATVAFWVVNPLDSEIATHKGDFVSGILQFKILNYVLLTLPIGILPIAYACKMFNKKIRIAFLVILGILLIVVIEQTFKAEKMYYPLVHWEYRALISITTAFFGGLMVIVQRFANWLSFDTNLSPFLLGMVIIMTGYQINLTILWNDFTNELRSEMTQNKGVVSYKGLEMYHNPVRTQFAFSWTVSTLALILHSIDNHQIDSIIELEMNAWQPWYPQDRRSWPNLEHYWVEYRF